MMLHLVSILFFVMIGCGPASEVADDPDLAVGMTDAAIPADGVFTLRDTIVASDGIMVIPDGSTPPPLSIGCDMQYTITIQSGGRTIASTIFWATSPGPSPDNLPRLTAWACDREVFPATSDPCANNPSCTVTGNVTPAFQCLAAGATWDGTHYLWSCGSESYVDGILTSRSVYRTIYYRFE